MADLLVVKLGGAALTDKTAYRTLRPVDDLVAAVAAAWRGRGRARFVLVHGAGSFGHHDVLAARLRGAVLGDGSGGEASDARVALGVAVTRASLATLHAHVLRALTAAGVPAVTVPTFPHGDGVVSAAAEALSHGLVPVLHGDVVIDRGTGAVRVLSGDALVALLLDGWLALGPPPLATAAGPAPPVRLRAVFVTGADGVFSAPPARLELRPRLIADVLVGADDGVVLADVDGRVLQRPPAGGGDGSVECGGDGDGGVDVSGGMTEKLRVAVDTVRRHGRRLVAVSIVGAGGGVAAFLDPRASLQALRAEGGTHVTWSGGDSS